DEQVVERALARGLGVLPGIATATELQRARRAGLEAVKFFPADRLGGLDTIAALAAPFPTMRFVPSGGVGPHNAADYLEHPAVLAVSGSWMVPRSEIAAGAFDAIERLTAQAVAVVGG
ncbi:MAG: keto-deoxy-phosphogluconate aldolase, partial [Leifsonia sp.]